MVSSVTSNPYFSYLSQLQGVGNTPSGSSGVTTPATTGASSGSGSSTSQSLVSSLLGGNAFTPEVLSLLQPSSSGTFNPITTLLGGEGTNDALTSLYTNLYDSAAAANLSQAQDQNTPATTSSGNGTSTPATTTPTTAESLIAQQTQASIAYNQTLQQSAANNLQTITNLVG